MNSPRRVRKVVVPAAGLGTRFLPATKAVPKEMLPIAGRPMIQFAVEEAAASGLETVIFVVRRGKGLLMEHFQRNTNLENILRLKGRPEEADLIRRLSELVEIRTVLQDAPLGLAHAIECARSQVGNEPFAVILPDALIDSAVPCIQQLMKCHLRHRGCIVATQLVRPEEVDRFGILEVEPMADACCGGRALHVKSLTERPAIGSVSSRYGIFGRYILEPEIFACIEHTRSGFAGEFQLTDSLALCSSRKPVYAYLFEGTHYDAGNKLGFLQATVGYALKDPEIARHLRKQMDTPELNPFVAPN